MSALGHAHGQSRCERQHAAIRCRAVDDEDGPCYAELLQVLGEVDGWVARLDPSADRPRPAPGSPLRADDERLDPYQLSHAVWHSLSHGVDHLNCLRTLLRDAGVIHMYAPYSLVRSALENASAAVWMLQPTRRPDRIARRLRFAAADISNGEAAKQLAGQVGPRSKAERLDQAQEIAQRTGIDQLRRSAKSATGRSSRLLAVYSAQEQTWSSSVGSCAAA